MSDITELWYSEKHTGGIKFSIRIKSELYSAQSDFQRIEIFDSEDLGRFLTLDGYMMLTERDEFIYHEMITHPAMAVHPKPENILVIGGGDGGVARELCRYDCVKSVDVVEIDYEVVEACRKFLPQTACGFDDERVRLHYYDGMKYIRRVENCYDVIIVDSTDPFGPGEGLFTKEFYGNCFAALREDGIMVNQHESPFYPDDAEAMKRAHKRIFTSFPTARVYQAHIPTYPSGHWLFGFASKKYDPVKDLTTEAVSRWERRKLAARYYNPQIHAGSFALPTYVNELLAEAER